MKAFIILLLVVVSIAGCKKKKNDPSHNFDHKAQVGSSANQLLSDDEFKKLIVEIQYVEGFQPSTAAVDQLKTFLAARLNKPDGIEVVQSKITITNASSYSVSTIKAIEDANRTKFANDTQIAAYFLFLDGEYSENTSNGKVLGIAHRNTSMVIFENTIHGYSDGIGEPERYKLETTVINHEFGHILGLVNVGSAMVTNHQDTAHGHHCDNESCLMHWSAETGDAVSNLVGTSPIPQLDANCISDLQKNGGK